jgi:protein-L-isoaspartate O-methyltransferase
MTAVLSCALIAAFVLSTSVATGQQPDPKQVAEERKQAELDGPKLSNVLGLKPGMAVADVGAGFGAMRVVLARSLESGRVFATDTGKRQMMVIQDYVKGKGLTNHRLCPNTGIQITVWSASESRRSWRPHRRRDQRN